MRDLPSGQAVPRRWLAFAILCCANLAAFSMTAFQAMLPIVMAIDGVPEGVTGAALSASVVPVVLVGLLCGRTIARIGAALVLACGYGLALLANLSLDLLPPAPETLFGMRMVHGVALGLVTPAALILGHHMASRLRGFASFAMFTSTIPGAQMIGPPLGDWWLQTVGREGFFGATSSLGGLALLLMCLFIAMEGRVPLPARAGGSYLALLRKPVLRPALLAHVAPALFWGYVLSFLTMMLQERGLGIPAFYQAMTLAVITTRIGVAGQIDTRSPRLILAICLTGMTAAFVSLAFISGVVATIGAGLLFGTTFAIVPPLLTDWIARLADDDERPRTVALGNSIFNGVTFLTAALFALALMAGDVTAVHLAFTLAAGGMGVVLLAGKR